jgi:hypothetical protein
VDLKKIICDRVFENSTEGEGLIIEGLETSFNQLEVGVIKAKS